MKRVYTSCRQMEEENEQAHGGGNPQHIATTGELVVCLG